jgi:ABC-type sugar transport system ATPase subunit
LPVSASAAIAFSNIEKSFKRPHSGRLEVVLRNFNLSIATGELVALVGPSGVGKTTLLHIAAGLERPDAGQVTADGSMALFGWAWCFNSRDC